MVMLKKVQEGVPVFVPEFNGVEEMVSRGWQPCFGYEATCRECVSVVVVVIDDGIDEFLGEEVVHVDVWEDLQEAGPVEISSAVIYIYIYPSCHTSIHLVRSRG